MATRQYENPWASGIKSLTGAYVAKQQGLAELARAQQEAAREAEQWAKEYALDEARTNSQLARDKSQLNLNQQEYQFNENHNPLLMDKTRAQTFSANASGQSSLASAENTRLKSVEQRLLNLAAQNNMDLTGGRSTQVYSPGQARVANSEEIAQLTQLAKGMEARAQQLPQGSPQRAEIERNLAVLRGQAGRAQQVFDMVRDRSPGDLVTARAEDAYRALEANGGNREALTPEQRRSIELLEAGQIQSEAGGGVLSESRIEGQLEDLATTYNYGLNLMDVGSEIQGLLAEGGDTIRGVPGTLVRLSDSLRGNVAGISELTGLIDRNDVEWLSQKLSGMTDNATDVNSLRQLVNNFAIMNYRFRAPASDQRMANFDLQQELEPFLSGSGLSLSGLVSETMRRAEDFYNNKLRTTEALVGDPKKIPEQFRTLSGRPPSQPAQPEAPPTGQGGVPEDIQSLLNKYTN